MVVLNPIKTYPQSISDKINYIWDKDTGTPQPVGKGERKITLKGVVFDHCENKSAVVDRLNALADSMTPQTLLVLTNSGAAVNLGNWCITSLSRDLSTFIAGKPIKNAWKVELLQHAHIAKKTSNSSTPKTASNSRSTNSQNDNSNNGNDWLHGTSGRSSNVSDDQAIAWLISQ